MLKCDQLDEREGLVFVPKDLKHNHHRGGEGQISYDNDENDDDDYDDYDDDSGYGEYRPVGNKTGAQCFIFSYVSLCFASKIRGFTDHAFFFI